MEKAVNLYPIELTDVTNKSFFLPQVLSAGNTAVVYGDGDALSEKNSQKVYMAKISSVGPDGSLRIAMGDGKLGVIPNNEISVKKKSYSRKELQKFIDREFAVVPLDNTDTRIIYFSIRKAKEILKEYYFAQLKEKDTVNAIIVFFDPLTKRVLLDIEGCGINGYVPIKEWSYGFIYNPQEQIKVGQIVKVCIEKFYPKRVTGTKVNQEHYRCSRKAILPNPWIGIETLFPKGTELVVTAELLTDKHNFFASTPHLDEIEVFCEYPDNSKAQTIENMSLEDMMAEPQQREKIIIQKGERYLVRVYKVSEEKMLLKARVIKHIENK